MLQPKSSIIFCNMIEAMKLESQYLYDFDIVKFLLHNRFQFSIVFHQIIAR